MNEIDKALYELFAEKALSEGCRLFYENREAIIFWNKWVNFLISYKIQWKEFESYVWEVSEYFLKKDCEIIWHEPQLHDVFRVAKEKKICLLTVSWYVLSYVKDGKNIVHSYDWTLSLMNQTDETKQSIINLFK